MHLFDYYGLDQYKGNNTHIQLFYLVKQSVNIFLILNYKGAYSFVNLVNLCCFCFKSLPHICVVCQ